MDLIDYFKRAFGHLQKSCTIQNFPNTCRWTSGWSQCLSLPQKLRKPLEWPPDFLVISTFTHYWSTQCQKFYVPVSTLVHETLSQMNVKWMGEQKLTGPRHCFETKLTKTKRFKVWPHLSNLCKNP